MRHAHLHRQQTKTPDVTPGLAKTVTRDDAVGLSLKLSDATSQSTFLSRPTNFRNGHSKAVARNKGKEHQNNCQFRRDPFWHGIASMGAIAFRFLTPVYLSLEIGCAAIVLREIGNDLKH